MGTSRSGTAFSARCIRYVKMATLWVRAFEFLATNLVEAITQPPPDLPICDTNMAKSQDPSENLKPITKIKTTQPKNDNIEKKQELRPKRWS